MEKLYWVNRYENGRITDKFMNQTEEQAKGWLSQNGKFEGIAFKAFDYDTFKEVTF